MKAALGFGEAVAPAQVRASLARQNAVRGGIKRVERLLERRAILGVLRQRASVAEDPSTLLYHCVVIKLLPPGRGTPGYFGDFPSDTALLPPHVVRDLQPPLGLTPSTPTPRFKILVPALGALERCLLPIGTQPGTCFRAAAAAGNSMYGRVAFVKVEDC
jgi:hypothetical protein